MCMLSAMLAFFFSLLEDKSESELEELEEPEEPEEPDELGETEEFELYGKTQYLWTPVVGT